MVHLIFSLLARAARKSPRMLQTGFYNAALGVTVTKYKGLLCRGKVKVQTSYLLRDKAHSHLRHANVTRLAILIPLENMAAGKCMYL